MEETKKVGRPSEMTPEVVKKLEEAFAIDATVSEACFYADISRQTYYEWIKQHPELADRFEALRERPVLKARQVVVKGLDDPEMALKYLERKKRHEFSLRTETDVTSKGESISQIDQETKHKIDQIINGYLSQKDINTGKPTGA